MPDISEIWDNLGYLVAPLAALALFLLSRRIPRKWFRVSASTFTLLAFMLAGLALFLDGYFLFGCTARLPGIISPDGKHVAVVNWTGIIFDENYSAYAHVSIRERFLPISTEVFVREAVVGSQSELYENPDVHWLDDHHLLISSKKNGLIRDCSPGHNKVTGIEVLCQE